MNILFVIANLGVGGAQSFLLRLVSAFPKEHNIYIYDVHPKQLETEILSNLTQNVKIFSSLYERIEIKLKKYPKIFTKILNRLNRYLNVKTKIDKYYFNHILKKYKIELINSHMYLADRFCYYNNLENIPTISTFHGCYNLIWDNKQNTNSFSEIKKEIQKILSNQSGIIIIAEKHKEILKKYNLKKNLIIKKIYHGFPRQNIEKINLRGKYSIPKKAFIFGMVARGDKTKGWQQAIIAFEKLQKEFKNIYLVLCGHSEYIEHLRKKFKNNKNIIFTGKINNPLGYIINFDVGLLPTFFPAESLPNTIIEYLYCKKPVIATDWAEIPKMIEFNNKKAGKIIPLKNNKPDIEQLYLAMKKYIEDQELLVRHSKLAEKAFLKFEMQNCVNEYINFFNQIIHSQ